jgi:hypothetical protein
VSSAAQAGRAHAAAWQKTAAARAGDGLGMGNVTWWAAEWAALRAAVPRAMWVAPLRAASCAAPTSCVGVDPDGKCVCVK